MPDAPAPATPEAPAAAPPPPEAEKQRALESPLERAAKAWDNIRMAAEARARAATTPAPVEAKPEEKKAETPAAPVPEKPKEEEALSSKFAMVARLERQAREATKAAKAKEESLAKREAEVTAKAEALEARRRAAKLNPIAWLQEAGLTLEEAAGFQADGGKPTAESQAAAALAQVEDMRKRQEESVRKSAEVEKQRALEAQQSQYAAWKTSVVDFVKENASTYELVNRQGAHELVPAVIQKHFDDTGKVLTAAEASAQVEKHLEEQAEKLLQSPKLAAKLKPKPDESAQPPRPAATPTLHNGLTASASSGGRPKTWAEKKEAARLAMEKATQPK